jgi:hypothetical protein
MMTPAEMMTIRCPTVFRRKLRGSLSSSSGSASSPSPTIFTNPPSGMMPTLYVVSPYLYEQNGTAGPNPMLNTLT